MGTLIFKLMMTLLPATSAFAQSGGGGGGGGSTAGSQIIASASFVYLADESTQGGDPLPGGATTYTLMSLQYNKPKYFSGLGVIYQSNSIGTTQKDTAVGLKLEFFYPSMPFYFEYVPYAVANQTFTNRAITGRDGTMTMFGFGMRSMLMPWLFFDGSFKIRTTTYTKEDGSDMPNPVVRTEKTPYLGLGVVVGI